MIYARRCSLDKRYVRYPVVITFGQESYLTQQCRYKKVTVYVIAPSPQAARDLIYEELALIPCTEIEVIGPKGGTAARAFIGYESAIGNAMFSERRNAMDE